MTSDQKKKIERDALSNGYTWNCDGSKLVKGNSTITYSSTGNSVKVNSSGPYNNPTAVRNSWDYNKK